VAGNDAAASWLHHVEHSLWNSSAKVLQCSCPCARHLRLVVDQLVILTVLCVARWDTELTVAVGVRVYGCAFVSSTVAMRWCWLMYSTTVTTPLSPQPLPATSHAACNCQRRATFAHNVSASRRPWLLGQRLRIQRHESIYASLHGSI